MGQYEVDFNIESFGNDENDIQYLKTAIDNLTNESEKQFQTIKNEKWFTRIIDFATLSNKKNIRMSQQISNIAQAQDILIELLKRLSATDVKIDNMLLNSMNQIEQLYNHTEKLAVKVKDLKEQLIYGINQSSNINDLKDIDKKVLYNLLQEASKTFESTTEEQRQFADNLFRYLQIEHSSANLPEAIDQVDSIAIKKVLLQLLLEYGFLNNNNFNFNNDFEELVELFDFGNKTLNETMKTIQNIYHLRGVEGFSWFNPVTIEYDYYIDLEVEELLEKDNAGIEDKELYTLEQDNDNFEEKEPYTLEPIMHINKNEVIKNKIINLSSIITVKGKLEFKNCEINIDNGFVPIILQTGGVNFLNCEINAIDENDSVLIKGHDDSEVNIYNSTIKTNIPIYECKSNNSNANINNSFIDSQHSRLVECKNINIIDSKLVNSERENLIGKYTGGNFIHSSNGIIKIKNSVFKNLKKIFSNSMSHYVIEGSLFENCSELGELNNVEKGGKILNTNIYQVGGKLILSNVDIENCEIKDGKYRGDIASRYFSIEIDKCKIDNLKLNKIESIRFSSSLISNLESSNIDDIKIFENNEFLESTFDNCYFDEILSSGNKILNSTFSNASITNDRGYLEFLASNSHYRDTKIHGCIFNNINVKRSYIINLNCYDNIDYKRFEICNNIFKDCSSNKSSFINLESFYFPKFSKNSKKVVLGIERDNIGVENVNSK